MTSVLTNATFLKDHEAYSYVLWRSQASICGFFVSHFSKSFSANVQQTIFIHIKA